MKKSALYSIVFLFVCLIVCLIVLSFSVGNMGEYAYADDVLTVSKDGEEFFYVKNEVESRRFSSLQSLIDDARASAPESLLQMTFNNVDTDQPIKLTGQVSIGGYLTFSLAENGYAVTVNQQSSLRLLGAVLTTNKSGILLSYRSVLDFVSGTIHLTTTDETPCAAIQVGGNANILGGVIDYPYVKSLGNAIIVENGGTLTIDPQTPIRISAPSVLHLLGGEATIKGGSFDATAPLVPSTTGGYSVYILNYAKVLIEDGDFPDPIYFSGASPTLQISDGTFSWVELESAQSGYQGQFLLQEATVRPSANSSVKINLQDFSSGKASFSSAKGSNGYRAYAMKNEGDDVYHPGEDFPIDRDVRYSFSETNAYILNIYDNETLLSSAEYPYNTKFTCSEIVIHKPGYSVVRWREDNINGNTIESFTLQGDKNVYVETTLDECVVEVEDVTLTYDGATHYVDANVSHGLKDDPDADYTAKWERYRSSSWQTVSENERIALCTVSDSGQYRFTATISDDGVTKTTQKTVSVLIQKGSYSGVNHRAFSGEYSPVQTLNSFELDEGFWWETANEVPTVPKKEYAALYNVDYDNYVNCRVLVTIDLEKVVAPTPDNSLYSGKTGVYSPETTLSDYVIRDTRWEDPDVVPLAGREAYPAYYNPDPDNYLDLAVNVTLTIAKGTYRDKDLSLTLPYSSALSTYAEVQAYVRTNYPGYRVTSGEAPVVGLNQYACIFNADAANYRDCSCTLYLTVEKRDYAINEVPVHPTVTILYGRSLSDATIENGFRFVAPETVPESDGDYPALYNVDETHYNDYLTTIPVTLKKLVYDPEEIPEVRLETIVYDKERTLGDLSLPNGFYWIDEGTTPTVDVDSYDGYYLLDEWHEKYLLSIDLTVEKATLPLPTMKDERFVYDGKPHSLTVTDLHPDITLLAYENNEQTEPGRYEVVARFSQADLVNYKSVQNVTADLIIEKAPCVIDAPDRIDVLLGNTVRIDGSLNNDEQRLILPEVSADAVGTTTVLLYAEESIHYTEGRKEVVISVNEAQKYVGAITYPPDYDGSYYYGILSGENGVPEDLVVSLSTVQNSEHKKAMNVSLTLDGTSAQGKYELKLLLPDEMRGKAIAVSDENGEVASSIASGVYLVLQVEDAQVLYFDYAADKKPFVWYWIPPVALVLVGGAVGLVLYLNKRKKSALAPSSAVDNVLNDNSNSIE